MKGFTVVLALLAVVAMLALPACAGKLPLQGITGTLNPDGSAQINLPPPPPALKPLPLPLPLPVAVATPVPPAQREK